MAALEDFDSHKVTQSDDKAPSRECHPENVGRLHQNFPWKPDFLVEY